MAQMNQRALGGPGIEQRKDLVRRSQKMWSDLMKGRQYDKDLMIEFYHGLALDIASEKKRYLNFKQTETSTYSNQSETIRYFNQ